MELRILKDLADDKISREDINQARYEIQESELRGILDELSKEGYIDGYKSYIKFSVIGVRVTMKGKEYINSNNPVHKMQKVLKSIKESIPGL